MKQSPVLVENNSVLGDMYEHPAFGCVQVSQWYGGETYHTGSSVPHNTGFTFRVNTAKLYQNHGRETIHANHTVVEFTMTPLQFVELMTSVGKGSGVPVTLTWMKELGSIPDIDKPKADIRVARDHVHRNAEETIRNLSKAVEKLAEMDTAGAISKKEFREAVRALKVEISNFASNISFPIEMAAEQAERTSSDIVRNAEAMVSGMLREIGTKSLQNMIPSNPEIDY